MERNQEQALYAMLSDKMDVYIIIVGYEDGKLQYVNHQVTVNMEMPKEDMIGRHYKDVFRQHFIKSYEELVVACADGNTHTTVYYWQERNIWEQISAVRVDAGGTQPVLLMTITNITEVSGA